MVYFSNWVPIKPSNNNRLPQKNEPSFTDSVIAVAKAFFLSNSFVDFFKRLGEIYQGKIDNSSKTQWFDIEEGYSTYVINEADSTSEKVKDFIIINFNQEIGTDDDQFIASGNL